MTKKLGLNWAKNKADAGPFMAAVEKVPETAIFGGLGWYWWVWKDPNFPIMSGPAGTNYAAKRAAEEYLNGVAVEILMNLEGHYMRLGDV